jgi:hypothetical protein
MANLGSTEIVLMLVTIGIPIALLYVVISTVLRPIHKKLDHLITLLEKR